MSPRTESFLTEYDGLDLPQVGSWTKLKHKILDDLCNIFATGMKNHWEARIYLDLFAGAGKCQLRDTGEILPGSPLISLSVRDPFDYYIFCESAEGTFIALQERVKRYFPERNCTLFNEDTNMAINRILNVIPRPSKSYRIISFCFIDPFNGKQLDFETIKCINSSKIVDFLILIPTYMAFNRNPEDYLAQKNNSIERFLGMPEWRAIWEDEKPRSKRFGVFVCDLFCRQMRSLGFIYEDPSDLLGVRNESHRNQRLYHLGYFTKNQRGRDFWEKGRSSAPSNMKIPFPAS